MDRTDVDEAIAREEQPEMWKLIRKLRWMGLEDEARRLQGKMLDQAPEPGGAISTETFNTD